MENFKASWYPGVLGDGSSSETLPPHHIVPRNKAGPSTSIGTDAASAGCQTLIWIAPHGHDRGTNHSSAPEMMNTRRFGKAKSKKPETRKGTAAEAKKEEKKVEPSAEAKKEEEPGQGKEEKK
nr:hypothetical protein [Candidatus Sigynarchaeota archaeon]